MPHVLWDRPRVRTKAEIPEECIREDILLKVKDGGKLEPKLFVLTRGKIYYTNVEAENELRGELDLSFVFVEFIDPVEIMDKELNNSIDEDLQKDYPCEDPRNFEINQTEEDEHEPKKVADLLKLPHHSRHNIAKGSIKTTDFHVHQKIRAEATNIDRENPDHHYLRDLLMSKIPSKMNSYSRANELLVNEKDFDEESIADEQTPLMTIRLISGNKFTEIATHDLHIFLAWKSVLKYYCFQANFHEEYRVDEIIEQKKYSKVYSVQHVRGNHRYTAKTISKDLLARDEVVLEKVRHELCIYKTIHHQNIVKLYEVFEDHLAVTLLFEYICGPTLELSTKAHFPYRNRDMICFLKECLEVLHYLHKRGVVHRDINPLTVLLRSHGKVSPLNPPVFIGLSKSLVLHSRPLTVEDVVCGRYGYVAPEVVRAQQTEDISGVDLFKVDVYGVGLLLYILMSAEDPHISYSPASNSKPAPLSFDSDNLIYNSNFDSFKPELRHIVKSMLRSDPSKRPSVEELLKLELLGEERIIKYKRKDEKRIKEVFNNRSQEEERSHSSDGNPTEKSSKSSSILMQKSSATQFSSPSTMPLPGFPSHQNSQNNTQAGHAHVPDSTTHNNDPIPLLNVFLPHWPTPTPAHIPDQSSHNNIHHSIPYVNSHKITSLHFTTTSNITMGGNCIDTDQFPVEGKVHSPPSINFSPGIN